MYKYLCFLPFLLSCGGSQEVDETSGSLNVPGVSPPMFLSNGLFENNFYEQSVSISLRGIEIPLKDKLLISFEEFEDTSYLILYSVTENVPDSRALTAQNVGYEFYKITDSDEYLGNYFFESSIDSLFSIYQNENRTYVVSNSEIVLFENDQYSSRYTSRGTGRKIRDTFFGNESITLIESDAQFTFINSNDIEDNPNALYKLDFNSDLILVNQELTEVSQISSPNISYKNAQVFDNNEEGRVVWSNVYLLKAYLYHYLRTDSQLSFSVVEEFVSLLGTEDLNSFLLSKRYSFNREPQLFLLHTARLYNLLIELKGSVPELAPNSVHRLLNELKVMIETIYVESIFVEQVVVYAEETQFCKTLKYADDSDYWANGINVPINYVSDVVMALLNINTEESIALSRELLECNYKQISEEIDSNGWKYWGLQGLEGWSNGFSNVPTYTGYVSSTNADISYMSTDAESFLLFCRKGLVSDIFSCDELRAHFSRLVENGYLYPYLIQYFEQIESNELYLKTRFFDNKTRNGIYQTEYLKFKFSNYE